MNSRIEKWYQAQREGKQLPCPRCGGEMNPILAHNALSRRETIYICDRCGMNEAIEDACQAVKPEYVKLPISQWYLNLMTEKSYFQETFIVLLFR